MRASRPAPATVRWNAEGNRLADLNFPFFSTDAADVTNVIACNLSMRREDALLGVYMGTRTSADRLL